MATFKKVIDSIGIFWNSFSSELTAEYFVFLRAWAPMSLSQDITLHIPQKRFIS